MVGKREGAPLEISNICVVLERNGHGDPIREHAGLRSKKPPMAVQDGSHLCVKVRAPSRTDISILNGNVGVDAGSLRFCLPISSK